MAGGLYINMVVSPGQETEFLSLLPRQRGDVGDVGGWGRFKIQFSTRGWRLGWRRGKRFGRVWRDCGGIGIGGGFSIEGELPNLIDNLERFSQLEDYEFICACYSGDDSSLKEDLSD